MKESIAITKEGGRKKELLTTKCDKCVHHVQEGPGKQLGSLRSVITTIARNGSAPSVESIATELSNTHAAQRASALLALQRTHGNRYVQRVVAGIQAKLRIGQPHDKYEQEADRVAEQVMRMPEPRCSECADKKKEEELIQTRPLFSQITPLNTGRIPEVTPYLESRINAIRGGGQLLPESVRAFFEPRFGYDFSGVRVHTDGNAVQMSRELNAEAFTQGWDIYFRAGRYSLGTSSGKKLLAHELTHVIQQRSQPDLFNKKVLQRQMRRATAADIAPNANYVVPPADERQRVDDAIAIIERVVNNPRDYPRCPTHFRDNCPGGTNTSLQGQYNRAIVWKRINAPAGWLGSSWGTSPNIAYTENSYRWSHWAIAASFVHEMMHICGVAGHPASTLPGYTDICDEAKHWCGRLPNL